jgi:hypothetical protein
MGHVLVVLAYTTVAAFQWFTTNKTYGEIQEQTRVQREAQRPWVGIVPGPITVGKLNLDTTPESNFTIDMALRNYGPSAASYVFAEFDPIWNRIGIGAQQKKTCNSAEYRESGSGFHSQGFGPTIFPQAVLPQARTRALPWPSPSGTIQIWISGCIVYRDQDSEVHRTRWCVYSDPMNTPQQLREFLDGDGPPFTPCNGNQNAG